MKPMVTGSGFVKLQSAWRRLWCGLICAGRDAFHDVCTECGMSVTDGPCIWPGAGFTNVRDIMDDLGDDVPTSTKSGYSAPWGNGESLFDDGFDFSSDPTLPGDPFGTEHDDDSDKAGPGLGSAGGSADMKRTFEDSGDPDMSTSDPRHKDYAFNASLPSGR